MSIELYQKHIARKNSPTLQRGAARSIGQFFEDCVRPTLPSVESVKKWGGNCYIDMLRILKQLILLEGTLVILEIMEIDGTTEEVFSQNTRMAFNMRL